MYDPKSLNAAGFISHEEICESMAYARANCRNRQLIMSVIAKAEAAKGLSHREAALLLECQLPDANRYSPVGLPLR